MSAPVHLVDASLYVFRAWHSMPDEFRDVDGWPVNAVQGFTRFVLELLERQKPERIAIAFDESLESNFRNALYPAYKANREPAPEELKRQFGHCQAVCRALGLPIERFRRLRQTLGSRTIVDVDGDAGVVVALNDVSHLAPLGLADDERDRRARRGG